MKFVTLAAVAALTLAACAAEEAEAAEIGSTGISIGAELDNNYNFDTEDFTITLTPEVGYEWRGLDFTASTDLEVLNNSTITLTDQDLPTLDLGVEYGIGLWALDATVYGETGYNFETDDMSAVEMGMKFSF